MTHCDDRHQATGGPIRGFAAEGQVRRPRLDRAERPRRRRAEPCPPGRTGATGGGAGREPLGGLLASMGAVVAGHATDLWGVVWSRWASWPPWPSTADSLGPAGHDARLGVGDLLGWGRFLVPPVAVAVGSPAAGRATGDGQDDGPDPREPARAVIGGDPALLAVAGLAALAGGSPPLGRIDRPRCPRPAAGWAPLSAIRSGRPSAASGPPSCWWPLAVVAMVVFTGVSVRAAAGGVVRAVAMVGGHGAPAAATGSGRG